MTIEDRLRDSLQTQVASPPQLPGFVDPGGEVLTSTGQEAGLAIAELDVGAAVAAARGGMDFLRDRRPDTYGAPVGTG